MLDLRLLRCWPITSWQDRQGACSAHTGTPEVRALSPSHAGGSSRLYEGFLLIPPQSTLKTRRAVCPVIHPAPPLPPLVPRAGVQAKMPGAFSEMCSWLCRLTHSLVSLDTVAFLFSSNPHQAIIFNCTRLPRESSKKLCHMLKTWKPIQNQRHTTAI